MTTNAPAREPEAGRSALSDGTRTMRAPVMWAIRDCRLLNAQEKALLWAIESRGVHYGTWETVAADAGMKRDAYYNWRPRLVAKGVLSATTRPGRTTLHEVDAAWFDNPTLPGSANQLVGNTGNTHLANQNDPSGNAVMKEDHEGDPARGPSKVTIPHTRKGRLIHPSEIEWVEPEGWTLEDCAPLSAWDRVRSELEGAGAPSS